MPGNPARGMLGDYLRSVEVKNQHEQAIQQHDLAQKQLTELSKYHQAEIDRMQNEFKLNQSVAAQTLRQHMIEHIASGMQQPPSDAGVTGFQQNAAPSSPQDFQTNQSGQVNLPTGIPQSLSNTGYQFQLKPEDLGGLASSLSPAERQISVASPEQISRLAAQKEGATEAAKVAAQEPERTSEEKIAQAGVDERLRAAQIAADQRTATATDQAAARKYAADTNYASRIYAANINANNKSKVNEEELGNAASDVSLGTADLPTGANGIHVQSILHGRGEIPFGKKNGGDKLDNLNDLDGLFQDMQDASKELPSKAQSAVGVPGQVAGQAVNYLKSKLPITTTLKNKMAAVDARSPEVVRNIFGIGSGRITNTEINKATQALVSGGMTQEDAQENINKLKRDTYTKVYSDILGAMPTKQKIGVLAQHGGLDRWRNIEINYKGQNIPVIRKMNNGREAIFNSNTGQYEGIEDLK